MRPGLARACNVWKGRGPAAGSATLVQPDEEKPLACHEPPFPPILSSRRPFLCPRRRRPRRLGPGGGRQCARDDTRRQPGAAGRRVEARLQPLPRRHRHAVAGHRAASTSRFSSTAAPRGPTSPGWPRATSGAPATSPCGSRSAPGVLWSDGQPFSGKDVAFTFDLMRRFSALDRAGVWGFLADVKSADASSVEFTFKRAYTPGLARHRHPAHRRRAQVEGRGPARGLRRPEPGGHRALHGGAALRARRLRAGPEPEVLAEGQALVSALRVPLYHTNAEMLRALEAGELDWASLFVDDVEKRWVAKDPARHLYWYPDFGQTVLLQLNTRRPPFDDASVRKAVSMALDRPRIMREALNGYAPPGDATGLAESQSQWKDAAITKAGDWTHRDVAQANALLDAAGLARGEGGVRSVPGGGPMRYDLVVVEGWSDWGVAAGIIRQNLAEVGIEADGQGRALRRVGAAPSSAGVSTWGCGSASAGPRPTSSTSSQMDPALVKPVGEKAIANFHRFANEDASRAAAALRGQLGSRGAEAGWPASSRRSTSTPPPACPSSRARSGACSTRAGSPASPADSARTRAPRRACTRTTCRYSSPSSRASAHYRSDRRAARPSRRVSRCRRRGPMPYRLAPATSGTVRAV